MGELSVPARVAKPGLFIVVGFSALIVFGAILLTMPISHSDVHDGHGFEDSLFTAVSAVTVTGLVVVDTGTVWSTFGEGILLTLIQIGGLGIMTFAGFLGIVVNQRLGLRGGMLAGTEIGVTNLGVLRNLLGDIVKFVFYSEAIIAVLLTGRFLFDGHGLWESAHLGLFHAVSAFNNAGFSILPSGLESYVGDWFVNLVIVGGFVLGGLGFPVVFEVKREWNRPRSWSLHTKVTLATSALLLVGGTVAIALIEWSNEVSFGSLANDERILASLFQSATARTAGFNTVPLGALEPASLMIFILLMVIGAGSASTGGGIKLSTFALVVKTTFAELRGDTETTLFDRTVPVVLQRQALAMVVAALGTVGTAAFLLAIGHHQVPLSELLFEAASAFGTVGVSTGVTTELDRFGRVVIIVLMFIGRTGPITFGTAMLLRNEPRRYQHPTAELLIG
ncbi:MAG: TrkH family potassium uptake protein [Actinomycetia bacterium]|nr:TrkH family potassium uptake protein [Actinomycetes bacterium]MCP5028870.1 TrkH family potassium uptake protein [Actinomycetes bacterium]